MQADPEELASLLAAVGRNDRQAFRTLYDRTSAKLFGVILRIVRSREMADEILQDAYLRVWQRSASYDEQAGRPMSWLIAIARYAAIDQIRRRTEARLPVHAERDGAPEIPAHDNPERDVMVRQSLLRCLGRLDETQREAVLLAYCSGYSREELASHFGRPVPTVKTWLHRSLAVLRLCLEGP